MADRLSNSFKWTLTFLVASVVMFLVQSLTRIWIYLAFFPAFSLDAPWMFVTSIFLHADTSHLFFNMLALLFFGTSLERMIGGRTFALLFISSGVVGNIGYLLTAGDPYTPAIGASGAIYGLIGALATLRPFMIVYVYGMVPLPMVAAAALWALLDLAGLFAPSGVAHGAHLSGMLVGVAFGLYYRVLWASLRMWRYIY